MPILDNVIDKNNISEKLGKVINAKTSNFQYLVKICSLDPKSDFIASDLSGVDFSNSDLRGFDFSDADLRNSYGCNFAIDKSTNFNGANLAGSTFEAQNNITSKFDSNSEAIYQELASGHWAQQAQWVASNVTKSTTKIARKSAVRLFFDVEDLTVKTDILLRLGNIFKSPKEYRDFILVLLANNSEDENAIKSAVLASSQLIQTDHTLYDVLNLYLAKADFGLFNLMVGSMLKSKLINRNIFRIIRLSKIRASKKTQSLILLRLSKIYGLGNHEYLMYDDNKYLNFNTAMDFNTMRNSIEYNIGLYLHRVIQDEDRPYNSVERSRLKAKLLPEVKQKMRKMHQKFERFEIAFLDIKDIELRTSIAHF